MISGSAPPQVLCDASVLGIDKTREKRCKSVVLLGRSREGTEQTGTGLRDGQTIDARTRIRDRERDRRGPMVCMIAVTWRGQA